MPSRRAITEEEYWRTFDLINWDVEAAIKANHTYFTINNLLLKDVDVYHKVNRAADFFQINAYALQTTFFIAFGRVFDTRRDAHSILKLVDATVANPQFFSKAAFRVRKRKIANIHGTDPDWLEPGVAAAWEPTSTDLADFGRRLSRITRSSNRSISQSGIPSSRIEAWKAMRKYSRASRKRTSRKRRRFCDSCIRYYGTTLYKTRKISFLKHFPRRRLRPRGL